MDAPGIAESTLADGKADIVGMAKTLIADAYFPKKTKAGRVDDIRTCIGCTQACVGHVDIGLGVGCIYNPPVTGREGVWSDQSPAEASRKIVIVGAGPVGMEAARIVGTRGHRVTLLDRGSRLGGQVNLVMKAPKRDSFEEIILWFERQLPKLSVDIRLRTEATVESILAEEPDEVILATGSKAYLPEIEGAGMSHVFTTRHAISGHATLGKRIAIFDLVGRGEAVSVADYLAERGHEITFITGLETVAPHMPSPTRHHQLERLMNFPNVGLRTHTAPWEITEGGAEVYNVVTWVPDTIEGMDTVRIGGPGAADEVLGRPLRERQIAVRTIGDGFQPRDVELAITDGHRAGQGVEAAAAVQTPAAKSRHRMFRQTVCQSSKKLWVVGCIGKSSLPRQTRRV